MDNKRMQRSLPKLIGLALFALLAVATASAANSKVITIGIISGFSGPYAGPGEDQWRAAQLAAEEINAKGGIMGRQIKLVRRDDKINPGEAGKMAQDMIQNDQPDFIISANSAATILPVNDQTKKAGLPYIAMAQNDKITSAGERGPFTFHEALTPTMNGRALGKWIPANLGKRVYYLAADYAFGKDNYAAMSKAVKEAGGTEVGVDYFPLGATDFSPFMAKIRAAKADVVVCISFGNDTTNLLKQIQSFGLTKEHKFFFALMDLQSDLAIGFQNLQGTYGGMNFYWELADKNAQAKRFVEAYLKRWNMPPSGYAGYAYSSMQLIKLGVEKAKSTEPAKFAKALEGLQYDSYKGKQWIRACDHQAFQPIFIVKARTPEEAKKLGREQYGLREIIGVVDAHDSMERSCKELGY
jgi:branched-chain amino acid transport system substrate-binding protein